MPSSENSLYPMLGTGAFFAMFMVGIVVGFELGLSCWPMLISGLLFGILGTTFVAKLEHFDGRSRRSHKPTPQADDPDNATVVEQNKPVFLTRG